MLMMKNSFHDLQYLDLIEYIIKCGVWKENRTGVRTKSVFGQQMIFDLSDGTIPLLTTKQMHTKSIIHELLWYLMGTGNIKYLQDNGVRIWNEWANEHGDLNRVYGVQWRHWMGPNNIETDQIAVLVDTLKNNPNDRRMMVSAWNVGELDQMALPPCHFHFQCYVANNKLSMMLNQRSCDVGLGIPFNIVQYSLLLRMLAEVTDLEPGELIWNGGDVHIYENHIHLLAEQVHREVYPSPTFKFARKVTDIDDFKFEDFIIEGYEAHPSIKMNVAV
jgi:thymidylate synthase